MSSTSKETLTELQRGVGTDWPAILTAADASEATLNRLSGLLHGYDPLDTSLVVFGSLARGEWTSGSDLDWTLLVDGQADPEHSRAVHRIRQKLDSEGFIEPGPTAVFGNMAFSHGLIHQIGGEDDTNRNITQRILLLLESLAIGRRDAYDRVRRQVLTRFLSNGGSTGDSAAEIPRVLLNDIVRYWRTMTVDFAFKKQARAGKGWALRNAKLRMSRKLIFASGLAMSLSCDKTIRSRFPGQTTLDRLEDCIASRPLVILAETVQCLKIPSNTIVDIFQPYDRFLSFLNDKEKRLALEVLPEDEKDHHPAYQEIRSLGHQFQRGLEALFFADCRALAELTKNYGVF